jgi:predicted GNAT family N-acyltransferase
MIRFIQTADVLNIRNEVLREGKLTPEQCVFQNDDAPTTFHLGYYVGEELACIASFHPEGYGEFQGKAYQLRGMATTEKYRGQGLGNQLVNFALVYMRGRQVNYCWCNARKNAVKFYKTLGFEVITPEFEVPGIGPHHVMYVKIQ